MDVSWPEESITRAMERGSLPLGDRTDVHASPFTQPWNCFITFGFAAYMVPEIGETVLHAN